MVTEHCLPADYRSAESELDAAIARFNATCDMVLQRIEEINAGLRAKKEELEREAIRQGIG